MKMFRRFLYYAFFSLAIVSCKKKDTTIPAQSEFIGDWTISKIYGNDSYGSPAHWKEADGKTKIKFTSNGSYLRKNPNQNTFTIVGGYRITTDSTIVIIPEGINGTSKYPSTLHYKFEAGDYMTWENFSF